MSGPTLQPDPPKALGSTLSRAPKQSLFPIRDSNGVIVGLSPKFPRWILGAAAHAELFFEWLSSHVEYAGSTMLAELLPQVYAAFCREHGLDPLPWRSIATVLKGFTGGKKYAWTRKGKRRRGLRVYKIPGLQDSRPAGLHDLAKLTAAAHEPHGVPLSEAAPLSLRRRRHWPPSVARRHAGAH